MEAGQRGSRAPQSVAMVIAAVLGVAGFAVAGLAVRGAESPSRNESVVARVVNTDSTMDAADTTSLEAVRVPSLPDSGDQVHQDRYSPPRYARSIEREAPETAIAMTGSPDATPPPEATAEPRAVGTQPPAVGATPDNDSPAVPPRKHVPLLGQVPVPPSHPDTLGAIFGAKNHVEAAVIGSVTALAANGTATVRVERVLAARAGVHVGTAIAIEQTLVFGDAPFGVSGLTGTAALAEGDHVLLLIRRAGHGWRALPLRGTWRIVGDHATPDVGIRGIASAHPESGNLPAAEVASAAEWARRYRSVPLADVVAEIRYAAKAAGWVVG